MKIARPGDGDVGRSSPGNLRRYVLVRTHP
jgi:hypothetical protein